MPYFPEKILKWKSSSAVNPYPPNTLFNTSTNFQELYSDSICLSFLKFSPLERILKSLYEDKGTGMKKQPELIGQERSAGGSVSLEMILELLDAIFHIPPLAVEVINLCRRGIVNVGYHKADIFAFFQILSFHDDAALPGPRIGSIGKLPKELSLLSGNVMDNAR